jgi:CubicO group peptidase (beta-lactamase class C family)
MTRTSRRASALVGLAFVIASGASCGEQPAAPPATSLAEFEDRVERLRTSSHIPALTALIAKGSGVVWVKGFGTADLATSRPAADTTVYHLASLTKPFAATVILQLVDEGKVSLDDPVSTYGINLTSSGTIRVRHLLSHTSHGNPGTGFSYDGDRFGLLDSVIARAAGKAFGAALQERIVSTIGLTRTAPNPQSPSFAVSGFDRAAFERNMARGYTYSGGGHAPTSYPAYFGTAAGLTASALDVAAFSLAMDRDALLRPETKALSYAPVVTSAGETLPYGLGWFSTQYKGVRIIWHYGLWVANSSLIIKVPERQLTFIVLANTDALSAAYRLGAGELETSPWAREFLDAFVVGSAALP